MTRAAATVGMDLTQSRQAAKEMGREGTFRPGQIEFFGIVPESNPLFRLGALTVSFRLDD